MAPVTAVADRSSLRVLGVDPGSRITGFGIVEFRQRSLHYVYGGTIKLAQYPFAVRLHHIYKGLAAVIEEHQPQVMAVEKVFVAHNAESALRLGHARGAAMVAATNAAVEVVEYTALQVKQAVVGNGKADKTQVQHMVRVLLGLRQKPTADTADALACGICHLHTWDNARRMNAASRGVWSAS